MSTLQASLAAAVVAATPLLYAALGEILNERVGVIDIGLEGIMLMGAVGGFIFAVKSNSAPVALLAGGGAGALFTLIAFTLPAVVMGASQVLVGFALWFLGIGLSAQVGSSYAGLPLQLHIGVVKVPLLHSLPWIGPIFFEQIWPVYLGVAICLAAAFVCARTRHGLNMKAIGDDPASAFAAGVAVKRWQAFYSVLGGFLAGIGGAILSVAVLHHWGDQLTAGRGFIALALVIFAAWRPLSLLWTSYLFGVCLVLSSLGQAQGWSIPSPILSMAPYLFTVLILVLRGWRALYSNRGGLAPAALGVPFIRGQR
ncbi:MAG: ABC transporter permease [Actinobacteria bacterium]|nr:ABC transporter permease [Actinomycetota bacterium]